MCKPLVFTTPRVNSNVNSEPWVITMYWCRLINCNKCNTPVGEIDNGRGLYLHDKKIHEEFCTILSIWLWIQNYSKEVKSWEKKKKKKKPLGKEQITTNPEYLETDMLAGSGVSRPQIQAISIKILIVVECSVWI